MLDVFQVCSYKVSSKEWLQDLHTNSHNPAGVLFASIPNFAELYDAMRGDANCEGCFTLLHELISTIDEV